MEIIKSLFGQTSDGHDVHKYSMVNNSGASVSILTLGGIIHGIHVPDENGTLENVSISYDSVADYENNDGFVGAAVGRSAGRISGAAFDMDGTTYSLEKNDGNNNLHGGSNGFDKVIWSATEYQDNEKMSITLHHTSPDMDSGFPGELDCSMTYVFNNDNALTIRYTCTSDKKTFVNLTNHCYFNLSGDYSTTIEDHILSMDADRYVVVDNETIPTAISPVDGTAFDFKKSKAIGQDINNNEEQIQFAGGYDHAFELNQPSNMPLITAVDPKTGRRLRVQTDAQCVVFYSGNYMTDAMIGAGNIPLQKRAAFCLETQYYPDAVNAPFVETQWLEPGQVYKTSTTYHFDTIK